MKPSTGNLSWILVGIVLAGVMWEKFPTMAVLYAVITGYSALLGVHCISGGDIAVLKRRGVPEELGKSIALRTGVLYLLNAALCPLGWALAQFVEFDTDFILIAQCAGIPLAALLGCAPLMRRKQVN